MNRFLSLFLTISFLFLFFSGSTQMRKIYLDNSPGVELKKISFFSASAGYVAFNKFIGYTADSGNTFIRKYISWNNVDYGSY